MDWTERKDWSRMGRGQTRGGGQGPELQEKALFGTKGKDRLRRGQPGRGVENVPKKRMSGGLADKTPEACGFGGLARTFLYSPCVTLLYCCMPNYLVSVGS